MAAAKHEMPISGKRAKMGTGRARSHGFRIWLSQEHHEKIAQLADAEGVTRTALIERWIDEHSALLTLAEGPYDRDETTP
jgi:hypothetical protein